MQVEFGPEALDDVEEIARYCLEIRSSLAVRFSLELTEAIGQLAEHPLIGAAIEGYEPLRRWHLATLPYLLIYVLQPDRVQVVQVFHPRRDPDDLREGRLR